MAFKIIILTQEWIHLQQQFGSNGISDKCGDLLSFDYCCNNGLQRRTHPPSQR